MAYPTLSLLIIMLLWALAIVVAYAVFFMLYPALWDWVAGSLLRAIAAILGSIGLLYVAAIPAMVAYNVTSAVAGASLTSEAANVRAARERVRETEEDALNRLEKTDQAGLLPLLRYSRAQLDEYYAMGLGQTRRSFFHALIAMWLGFILLIMGLALYVAPVERLGLLRPSQDFNIMILSTAAIIEVISVLFLWIYRSTMGQLTFYYRLQIRNHTSILCFRMTTGMTGRKDDATRAIINAMLDSSLMPERPAVEGSRGLAALLRPGRTGGAGPSPPPTAPSPAASSA